MSTSKHWINDPKDCVDECLEGLVAVHSNLRLLGDQRIVLQDSVLKIFRDLLRYDDGISCFR